MKKMRLTLEKIRTQFQVILTTPASDHEGTISHFCTAYICIYILYITENIGVVIYRCFV